MGPGRWVTAFLSLLTVNSGTCVNVGCIPKKLMHRAALIKEDMHDAVGFGWNIDPASATIDWNKLVGATQMYIKSLNFGYRSKCFSGRVIDSHYRSVVFEQSSISK